MNRGIGVTAGVAALALVAACSSNPKPAATTPQVASAAQQQESQDAAARAQARRDSIARADSLARKEALAQSHADSVRAEVMRETVAPNKDVTNLGLSASDDALMTERVHFDYNKADLKPEDIQLLQQKLGILEAHPQLVIQVAGNCDERGSDEYNMALGERRAAAAKRWLEAHGIASDRIGVTSYGKERPLDPGHDEAAWAKNRRDDFVVTRRVG
ncbi:MAG TPA: peptidoglycan-associated lipoprotein Pal [Gemmatimonadales bacterium]|nr:peptidoglycan-associated lipoprotein Pal [Gemmatimonadales bacterium]